MTTAMLAVACLPACGGSIESLDAARLLRPRVDREARHAWELPFDVEPGSAYGMRVRCDAHASVRKKLGYGEVSLGTAELTVSRKALEQVGVDLLVSPARLERLSYRMWSWIGSRRGDWHPAMATVPWEHPEETSRLPIEEYWRRLLPQVRREYGPRDFELVDHERFTWTYDIRLDLRGMRRLGGEVRSEVRPQGGYPTNWYFKLRPDPGGHLHFIVAQTECLELPYP